MSVAWGLSCVFPLREDAGLDLGYLKKHYEALLDALHRERHLELKSMERLPHALPSPLAPLAVLLPEEVEFDDFNVHITQILWWGPVVIGGDRFERFYQLVLHDHPDVTFDFLLRGTRRERWKELKEGRYDAGVREGETVWKPFDLSRYSPERVAVVEELVSLGYDPQELYVCDPLFKHVNDKEGVGETPCLPPLEARRAVEAAIETAYRYEEELSRPPNEKEGPMGVVKEDPHWLEVCHLGLGRAVELQLEKLLRVCRTAERYGWLVAGSVAE